MRSPRQILGHAVEEIALSYLHNAGLVLEKSNYFCQGGEIDLIMRDKDVLVFIEVRYRQDDDYGSAVESVTKSKQRKIIKAAKMYLQEKKLWDEVNCRFDVVVVQDKHDAAINNRKISWLKDAFWAAAW